jgi:hypothetical protein
MGRNPHISQVYNNSQAQNKTDLRKVVQAGGEFSSKKMRWNKHYGHVSAEPAVRD